MSDNDFEVHEVTRSGRKIGAGVLDPKKVIKLKFQEGMKNSDIAEQFGVTPQAVGQMIKRINKEAIGHIYSRGSDLIESQVSVQMMIAGLMADASRLLRDMQQVIKNEDPDEWTKESADKRKILIATMAEIRAQLNMYNQINDKIYSVESNQEFQRIVIETIKDEDPAVAKKIIERLYRRQPLREFIGAARRSGEADS